MMEEDETDVKATLCQTIENAKMENVRYKLASIRQLIWFFSAIANNETRRREKLAALFSGVTIECRFLSFPFSCPNGFGCFQQFRLITTESQAPVHRFRYIFTLTFCIQTHTFCTQLPFGLSYKSVWLLFCLVFSFHLFFRFCCLYFTIRVLSFQKSDAGISHFIYVRRQLHAIVSNIYT